MAKLLFVISIILIHFVQQCTLKVEGYTRADFPSDFIFGSGTSAYQVEGAATEDGRTRSIYDTWAFQVTGEYAGDVACDEYHKYKEDVQLMVETGVDAYRFSISWTRLIPNGTGAINQKGVDYYNNLINELIKNGIQPHVTLLQFDFPQVLQDAYGGWMDQQMVMDFTAYAEVCFKEFGDRVLHWTTINEPIAVVLLFYDDLNPYIAAHNLLLGHASVVNLYRQKFQEKQNGSIGLNQHARWFLPATNTKRDIMACERASMFVNDWFTHPIVYGDYPNKMKLYLGTKLPSFTKEESKLVKGSFDFIAINCYTASIVEDDPQASSFLLCFKAKCNDKVIGGKFIQGALEHLKQVYGNPPVYIHENGLRTFRNVSFNDTSRITYLNASIGSMLDSLRNGSNVKGYFQWSFLDLFEFSQHNEYGFGLYYVDLQSSELRRYPKRSALWYSNFLKGKPSQSYLASE
ncbi:cyanidin 3-O-glucoside 5-O-glucosyltransferase (acyl-glucose)-like [Amaranthus tricolor]|uniref:cyanidin 3-O-glucoside 5-O-glucosyltransferase (acyl-glucose)-like n=1 Tax=Amaranthus tricolor TaxID=29722 RepID=UPI00258477C9|nr:cyanidin 3-O-glucoside 5-O-glucosyltransferase (acyl-glucose)-like [Amaranthus tricolor]